jgi:hypothetical protein
MNNYREIILSVTFILLSICTRHVGAQETDRQALPPIQFVEGDTRFAAANQERVDLVTQIPGLVALWDFVQRRDSWQTHNPFISIPGKSGGRAYELEPRNISLDFWQQDQKRRLPILSCLGEVHSVKPSAFRILAAKHIYRS